MADARPDRHIGVTSNEPVDQKHLVQPYAERPVVRHDARACKFCGNPNFRRSRMRLADLPRLLLLQCPVRCTRCGQRQRASLRTAVAAGRPQRLARD